MLGDSLLSVNGVSLESDRGFNAARTLNADHQPLCHEFVDEQCVSCRLLFGSMDYEQRRRWLLLDQMSRARGEAGVLPAAFLNMIAFALAQNPKLFAPIVQFLNQYERSSE